MLNYDNILHLDLEVSSLCNALCPVCNRRDNGGPKNINFKETYLTLDTFKSWFTDEFVSNLYGLQLCGNYGDPMTNPELIDILTYIRYLNKNIYINMNTNASGRDPEFWRNLAKIIGKKGEVTFSIDGLEDTNFIYRRGTYWNKIMSSVTNFIDAGGHARWEFLVFKHNQHQIEDAEKLSIELGFKSFHPKTAMGFVSHNKNISSQSIKVLDEKSNFVYSILPPDDEDYNNDYLKTFKPTEEDKTPELAIQNKITFTPPSKRTFIHENRELTDYEKKLGDTKINCEALPKKGIFVSSEGLVFPCCFTASKYYAYDSIETVQIKKFVNDFGADNINLNNVSLKNIINGPFFQQKFPENFADNSIKNKRLITCSLFCGTKTNMEVKATLDSINKN